MAQHINFESFDGKLRRSAEDTLNSIRDQGQSHRRVAVTIDPQLALVLAKFLNTALERGGVAYGPLEEELSPSQAGKILGISRPLVVRRMEDGRLPFHYVGTHRRCTLKDVLELKAREEAQDQLMTEIYQDFEEIGDLDEPPAP